ncbi:MAG: CPBP family intramembrane metalloprotease [Lachnospiraceae bacterium]|nr:CPBP family intramembrane metalloprotease [Lachnospiraceae bacterium]
MRRYSVPRQVWRVFYPIIVYLAAQALAEMAIAVKAFMGPLARRGFIAAPAEVWTIINEGMNDFLRMTLPALAIAALVSLPLLGMYLSNDREDRMKAGAAPWPFHGGVAALAIVLGAAACLLGNALISLSGIGEVSNSFINVETMLFSSNIFVEIAIVGVLIPIVEELIYRGLAFRRMRDSISFVPAALITALLFALVHGNIVQGLYAFGTGILLAYVYERSGSLAAPILLHMTANICSVLFTEITSLQNLFVNRAFFFGSMAAAAVLIVVCILVIESTHILRQKRGLER